MFLFGLIFLCGAAASKAEVQNTRSVFPGSYFSVRGAVYPADQRADAAGSPRRCHVLHQAQVERTTECQGKRNAESMEESYDTAV